MMKFASLFLELQQDDGDVNEKKNKQFNKVNRCTFDIVANSSAKEMCPVQHNKASNIN